MAKKAGGRPAIYGPKNGTKSYRALCLTKEGQKRFELTRREVKRLHKWRGTVSDADVIEHLVRK